MGRAFEVRKQSMAKTASAKSKVYAKYGKEIYMAAKSGEPDPEINLNLKRVIERAKKDQVTTDVINRAIEKAKGSSDESYFEIKYEGFGPGNSLLIIECVTDNSNRALSEVRTQFNKVHSKLGVSGSVMHQFEYQAVFEVKGDENEILELLLEENIEVLEVEVEGEFLTIYAEPNEYANVRTVLKNNNIEPTQEEVTYLPITLVEIKDEEELARFDKLLAGLEDLDDVSRVYHNIK